MSRKSAADVISMLAALKAGRFYVPVDPSAPEARREFMLRQSGAEFIPGEDLQPGRTGGTGPPGEPRAADRDGEAGVPYTPLYVCLNECQGTGTVSAGCARRGLPRSPQA